MVGIYYMNPIATVEYTFYWADFIYQVICNFCVPTNQSRLHAKHSSLVKSYGEPTVPQVEHLFKNIFEVYEKLKALGFTYYNGKVTIIDTIEEKKL